MVWYANCLAVCMLWYLYTKEWRKKSNRFGILASLFCSFVFKAFRQQSMMKNGIDKKLIQALPVACAYHKMVYDDQGLPSDYIFLDVNSAFELHTALKADDIIGKKVTDILRDSSITNWIKRYGDVVTNNDSIEFDDYSVPLKKWFHVYAFCPHKDHFITIFFDISVCKTQCDEQLAIYSVLDEIVFEIDENLRFQNIYASDEASLYKPKEQVIGKSMFELFPEKLANTFAELYATAKQSGKRESLTYQSFIPNEEKWFQTDVRYFTDTKKYIASVYNITEQQQLKQMLQKSETLFESIFEQAPYGIAVGRDYRIISHVNPMFEKILGRSKEELVSISWTQYTHPDDLKEDLERFEQFKSGQISGYTMEKRFIRPDGSIVWVNMTIAHLRLKNREQDSHNHLCMIEDITDRINTQQALYESERSKSVYLSHLPGLAYRCKNDEEWTMEFVSDGCFALTGYKPESLLYNRDLSYNALISPTYKKTLREAWDIVLPQRSTFKHEYEIITADNKRKWVLEIGQGVYDQNGEVEALEGIIIDISDQKKREKEILYINAHDHLTGLYNRRRFEEEVLHVIKQECWPLSIIVADINGLRLINDAFGHLEGDKLIKTSADILCSCIRRGDILARVGGDEFSILMPNTDAHTAGALTHKITNACAQHNNSCTQRAYDVNLSVGFSTLESKGSSIEHTIREAESSLRNHKLLSCKSTYSAIISSIMATLYARSHETEEHAQRLAELSIMIGSKLKLPEHTLDKLRLFAMLHDIGKVGIDDRILNKPAKLTAKEWNVMKGHPEIGYRIAMSSPELEPIAEYILTHHERYDGKGYPQGLKSDQIPLLSRIMAVVDAYDAMTKDRVYRKAMSKEDALKEIEKNAGTQFDPAITQIFLKCVN